tara:strand:+ start:80 stop:619 length:540 start_codon:yes stop_codon:yes gene_type:complete
MKLYDYLIGFARAYPLIIISSSFLSYFLTLQINYFMLGIALLVNDSLNGIFKIIIKSSFGEKIFGILGKRPIGAKNCGYFSNSKNSISKSYGMPSGHSQNAVFFSTFVIMNMLDSDIALHQKTFGISLFICLSLGIMYSRVYLNCHTIPQVVVGGLIGFLLAKIYYEKEEEIKKYLFNV